MINSIYANSQWINVQSYVGNRPYMNTAMPANGTLRYNSNVNGGMIEVFDGNAWQPISDGSVKIDFSEQAKQTLAWAYEKMEEERKLKDLMSKHPGLKELKDKFEMMRVLCQEGENKNEMV